MEKLSLESKQKKSQIVQDSDAADSEDEEYLSNKYPIIDVVLAKPHVNRPYQLNLPAKLVPQLPHVRIPVVIRCGGKDWNMSCTRNGEKLRFCSKWEKFVNDNNLKIGDACVFELRECSDTKMKFKVVILRNDLPLELLEKRHSFGGTVEKPIEID